MIEPSQTHVVSIGVEQYEQEMFGPLAGVASGAIRFARWAVSAGADPANVRIAISPAAQFEGNDELSAAARFEATFDGIQELFVDLAAQSGDLILVYWAGHGVLNDLRERVLFVSNSDQVKERYFRVDNLHQFLASEAMPGFDHNVLFIDACANFAHEVGLGRSMTNTALLPGKARRVEQWTLYSASQGEYAMNDAVLQRTAFSGALLPWLEQHPTVPIDFDAAVEHVTIELEKLSDDGTTMQHPVRRDILTPRADSWESNEYGGVPVSGRDQREAQNLALTIDEVRSLRDEMRRSGREPPRRVETSIPGGPEGGLVGRGDVIEKAVKRLLAGNDVALLSGLPGVGKTALAVELARDPRLKSHFPGGCLWLRVGDPVDGIPHWVHGMATWCSLLGVSADRIGEAQSAEDGPQMAKLAKDALGERRALLVFDDVWSAEDAVLFDGVGVNCRRIMTTRIPEAANLFTHPVRRVEELNMAASEELLERHCENARDTFGERLDPVLEAIGGLPLTLVLVGTRLNIILTTLGVSAANEFLEKLLEADARLKLPVDKLPEDQRPLVSGKTLEAVMEMTTERLTRQQVVALKALTIFPPKANTFSRRAGEVVAGSEERFVTLVSNGLVELYDQTGGRFALHRAIVDFARRGRSGDKSAYRRMTNYFIDFVHANTSNDRAAWAWVAALRPEGDNLRAALMWTISARETRLGMRLMAALWPFWYRTSQFQRALNLAEQVLDLPEPADASRDDHLLRAKLLNDAGNYAYNMSDLDTAEHLHTSALAIRETFGEEALTAGSLNNLGLVFRERGNYDKARDHLLHAKEINERTQHEEWRLWRGMNLNNLELTSARAGELKRAREEQVEAVEAFRSIPNEWGVAMAQTDLAEVLIELGNADEAELILDDVLPNRVSDDDPKAVAAVLRALAAIQLSRGQAEKARRLLLAAMSLSAPISDRLGQGKCLERLIIAAYQAGDYGLAARAEGALQAYGEATGVRTASRVVARIEEISIVATSGDFAEGYATARESARSVATQGLVALLEALGPAVRDVVTNQEIDDTMRDRYRA